METAVDRERQRAPLVMGTSSNAITGVLDQAELPESLQATGERHPEMFYPSIPEVELTVWTHWLPRALVFKRGSQASRQACLNRLSRSWHRPCSAYSA